jgi:fluoride ion exporter CrcB/FEX
MAVSVVAAPQPVYLAPPPDQDPLGNPRKVVTYCLIGILGGVLTVSAIMLSLMLLYHTTESAHFVLEFMGIALGAISALTGSAITFYMQGPNRN